MSRPPRPYVLGCLVGIVIGTVAFVWLLTAGSWNLFQRNLFANFYDVQARALFHGHWNVASSALSIEGIREGTRTYMYYGPVPAILRMPVLLLTHRLDGRLTQVSMLLAFIVAMVFVARLTWRVRSLISSAPVSRRGGVLAACWMVAVGVGSQFFYLGSDAIIYHEAEIWGAALALGAFDCLVAFIVRPSRRALVGAGILSVLAILTRGSVGAGPVAAIGLLACAHAAIATGRWLRDRRADGPVAPRLDRAGERWAWLGLSDSETSATWTIGLLVAAVVPVVLYVAINEVKFATLVSLPLNKQVFTSLNLNRRVTLADNGGSLFGLKFVPTALLAYLRPDALELTRLFPFVRFPGKATVLGGVHYDTRDFSSSLTATMPLLAVLSVVGLVGIFGPAPGPLARLSVLRLPVIGAALGTIGVLAIAFIANRYLADFMPPLVIASLGGLAVIAVSWRHWRPWLRRLVAAALVVLALLGGWANVGLGLIYQRELRPSAPLIERDQLVSLQQRLATDLFGGRPPDVRRAASLPAVGPPEALEIVGDCVGLYQSDGNEWRAVERSAADGHLVLKMVLAARPGPGTWPVVVNGTPGAGDYLALRSLGGGRDEFAYLFQGLHQGWITGVPFVATPGRAYVLDVVFDALVDQVEVHLDGQSVLSAVLVRPSRPIEVGHNPLGGPVAASFPGRLTRLPVTTPICSSLLARMERR